jgi:hypothetical protein
MTQRLFGLVALVAVVAVACGAPPLSIAEYSVVVEDATDVYIAESQTLSGTFQKSVEDEIASIAESGEGDLLERASEVTSRETVQYLALLEDAMVRYLKALTAVVSPDSLSDAHEAYVAALQSVRASMPATRTGVEQAADLAGIQTAITSSGFSDGQLRLQAACADLETAVRSEGHGIDLGCTPTAVSSG